MCYHRAFAAFAAVLFLSTGLQAAVVTVGSHTLAGNQAGQTINILISGTEQVQALDFFVQIGDGGTANSGTDTAPIIQGASVVGPGTVFPNPNNTGNNTTTQGNLMRLVQTETNTGTVLVGNSILATLTVDTTGILTGGTFALKILGVGANLGGGPFNTQLVGLSGPISLKAPDGQITVLPIPEPAGMLLIGAALPMLLRRRR